MGKRGPSGEPRVQGALRTLDAMRDVADNQLRSADGRDIGRVADLQVEWQPDGSLVVTHLVCGPEALVGRVASRLRPLAHRLLRGRFEARIPVAEAKTLGPTIELRGPARAYPVGRSERWIASHLLRYVPGSGYKPGEV